MKTRLAATTGTMALALAWAEAAQAQPMSAAEAAQMREEVALLKARIEQLEKRLDPGQPTAAAPAPTPPPALAATALAATAPAKEAPAKEAPVLRVEWKGSPRTVQGDRAFKVKGRIQADANYVSHPGGSGNRLADKGLGFSNEFRRLRLGGEGKLGSGFGYKLEFELSDNQIDLVDTFVTYEKGPWLFQLGNQNPLQSLDELTGDTTGSFMERAAFTDAFAFERRLGLTAHYRRGPLLAQVGVFTDDPTSIANASDGAAGGDENNSFGFDGRLVYAPKLGATQLHLAGSAHWRNLGRVAETPTRYRQRPYAHSSNSRLIGTPALRVEEEFTYGAEFAAIRGPWHAVVEGHRLQADRLNALPVRFWGGYAELGYFLTGETRAYENGIFGNTKPRHALGDGGIGAVQVNLRYDYLTLNDRDIRGGTQNAYLAALIWTPIQYLRFNLNYGYVRYTGAVPLPDGQTDYGLHVIGSRFELDF